MAVAYNKGRQQTHMALPPIRTSFVSEDDIGTQKDALQSAEWYEQRGIVTPTQAQERQNDPTHHGSPPPYSSPHSSRPTTPKQTRLQTSASPPDEQAHQAQYSGQRRYELSDSGPQVGLPVSQLGASGAAAAAAAGYRVEDKFVSPSPNRLRGVVPASASSGYATFREMGFEVRAMAEIQAEKSSNCVVM